MKISIGNMVSEERIKNMSDEERIRRFDEAYERMREHFKKTGFYKYSKLSE